MATKPKEKETTISVAEIHKARIDFWLIGMSALVPHAMSFKAMQQLLFPSPRKNAAERATSMKHEPWEEFRDAAYQFQDHDDQPTRLYMPAAAFKGALSSAALDMVGARKAQIGRLAKVLGEKIPVWGIPKIWCTVVRSSDPGRTPDIRTLPILPHWCARITVQFINSLIKDQSIANLLGASGEIVGVGDGRPQNGKLDFGTYEVTNEDNPEVQAIINHMGRKAQDEALAQPEFYDLETERLLTWFDAERERRHASPPIAKRRKTDGDGLDIPAPATIEANQSRRHHGGRGARR